MERPPRGGLSEIRSGILIRRLLEKMVRVGSGLIGVLPN